MAGENGVLSKPRSMRRSITVVAATALAAAGATAVTVSATPSRAAACNGYVGLTYDDGPNASTTTSLLSALTEAGLRATFFNIGQNAAGNPALVRAEVAAGMWIGNHSWDHADMVSLTAAQMDSQLSQTQAAIQAAGAPAPQLFRPPYGNTSAALKAAEAGFGLTEVLWDIDTRDWSGISTAEIVAAATLVQDGQVILMHDGFPNTIAAVPLIAADLQSRGLCPGMISTTTGRAVAPDGSVPAPTTPPASAPTTPPTATPPTTTPPTTVPPATTAPANPSGACTATYSVVGKWTGGFQAGVTVTNPATAALSAWTVQLALPAGQTISSLWGGVTSGTSGAVTVRNAPYNGTLAAGASTVFGYVGTGDGTATPTVSCS